MEYIYKKIEYKYILRSHYTYNESFSKKIVEI